MILISLLTLGAPVNFWAPATIVPPTETYSNSSPVTNLWSGKYIPLGGIDFLISSAPLDPTTTEVNEVPIPTDLESKFLFSETPKFSRFEFTILNENSLGSLNTDVSAEWLLVVVELKPLEILYELFIASTAVIIIFSLSIVNISPGFIFPLETGSVSEIEVVTPVVAVSPIATLRREDIVLIFTVFIPLMSLNDLDVTNSAEELSPTVSKFLVLTPEISIKSLFFKLWGKVHIPTTLFSITANLTSTLDSVVCIFDMGLPLIFSTSAFIDLSLNITWSPTLYLTPGSTTFTVSILSDLTEDTLISGFDSTGSDKKGYVLKLSFIPKWVTFLL